MAEADGARPPAPREVRCRGCGELLAAEVGGRELVLETVRVRSPVRLACRRCGREIRWRPGEPPPPPG